MLFLPFPVLYRVAGGVSQTPKRHFPLPASAIPCPLIELREEAPFATEL